MQHTAKCPSCKAVASYVVVERVELRESFEHKYSGYVFVCPSCDGILGVGIDPHPVVAGTDTSPK